MKTVIEKDLKGILTEPKNSVQSLIKTPFDSYIDGFLRPRLVEAYRILKSHGSLYFHIDYREVHYCKLLLDDIFGRECFLNEIIWAYDYGGRAKSRWPAKHDNILYYVKNPKKYILIQLRLIEKPYMAPGLVDPEKAQKGKLPTDTWWANYTGIKDARDISDTWWLSTHGSKRYVVANHCSYEQQRANRISNTKATQTY